MSVSSAHVPWSSLGVTSCGSELAPSAELGPSAAERPSTPLFATPGPARPSPVLSISGAQQPASHANALLVETQFVPALAAVVPEGQPSKVVRVSPVPEVRKKSPLGQTVNDGVRFGSAFTKCRSCSTAGSTSYCARFSVALS